MSGVRLFDLLRLSKHERGSLRAATPRDLIVARDLEEFLNNSLTADAHSHDDSDVGFRLSI